MSRGLLTNTAISINAKADTRPIQCLILICSVIGSFLLCLVFAQFGEETKTRKSFRSDEDCHETFNTYMPFVWGENSEKLYFRKTTATLAEKILQ